MRFPKRFGRALRAIAPRKSTQRALGAEPNSAPQPTPRSAWAAVAIRPGLNACRAVRGYCGRRILEADAPALPVPGCDSSRCECRLRKYPDRRAESDRRTPYGMAARTSMLGSAAERRAARERREPDDEPTVRAYFNDYGSDGCTGGDVQR